MAEQMPQTQLDGAYNLYNQGNLVGMYSYLSSFGYQ